MLAARADRQLKGQPEPEAETRRLAAIEADIDLGEFERRCALYESQPWAKPSARAVLSHRSARSATCSTPSTC